MSILRRLRSLAASLFVVVVVPGVTAAATMLGFLATATYVTHSERNPEPVLDAAGRVRLRDRGNHAHAGEQGDP